MSITKQKILNVGAGLVRRKGFNHTGIQEILDEAKVPKGSFYFYFESKESFGLELIEVYVDFFKSKMEEVLTDKNISGLKRIRLFLNNFNELFISENYTGGCPLGNLAQEMGDLNERFSKKVSQAFVMMESYIQNCLKDAIKSNELTKKINVAEMAQFILNSWEGAVIRMKVEKSVEPIKLLEKIIFNNLLK